MNPRPTGTVTFLFTDIEGSTKLWEKYPDAMKTALARHDALMRDAVESNDGYLVKTTGDGVHAAFALATNALDACIAAQRALQNEIWNDISIKARMALYSGIAEERGGDYYGQALNRAARLMSAGHGGQILLSQSTFKLLLPSLSQAITLRDMGERRLKDLIRSEHVYQVVVSDLPCDFPPLKTLDARPNNLPAQTTLLIGREAEIRYAKEKLSNSNVRLLTLTGVGGTGKTRLALQVAADLVDDFEHGVFFVPLASITDPALVLQTIAQTFDLREAAGRQLIDRVKDYLREKELLLVLDNFEQIVDAAPTLADLSSAAPRLKILVTSRELLRLASESSYAIPPLSLPDPKQLPQLEQLGQCEAVALFIERAQAVKHDFNLTTNNAAAVAEICYQLDGLPLAIELAAARVRLLPPQKMLAQLNNRLKFLTGGARDLPARQQTLQGAMDWSYDLLSGDEQTLFRRLSVFVGGCTLEAVEAVCNADGKVNVLNELTSLVDKSLVKQTEVNGESRFTMLETIREYARERLQDAGEGETIRNLYLDYFMKLAEEAKPNLRGVDQLEWLDHLDGERENLRAALEWSLGEGRVEKGLRLAAALSQFWQDRGNLGEATRQVGSLLTMAESSKYSREFAQVLSTMGNLLWVTGNYANAHSACQRSVAIFQQLGDNYEMGYSLVWFGFAAMRLSHFEEARIAAERAVSIFQEIGDRWGMGFSSFCLGRIALESGNIERARELHEASVENFRQTGDQTRMAFSLNGLATVILQQGELDKARRISEESLDLRTQAKDTWGVVACLKLLGDIACLQGDYVRSADLDERGSLRARELGLNGDYASLTRGLGFVALYQGNLPQAEALFVASLNMFRKLASTRGIAECLLGFSSIATDRRDARLAVTHLSMAESFLKSTGNVWWLVDQVVYDENKRRLSARLDEASFNVAWEEGKKMTMEQAIALALETINDSDKMKTNGPL